MLNEDRQSVAFPSFHARGLIRFRLENPNFHFERRVDMFRCIFPPNEKAIYQYILSMTDPPIRSRLTSPSRYVVYDTMKHWFDEAMDLDRRGMPSGSFSLVFTGASAVKEQVWYTMKENAALQDGLRECRKRGHVPTDRSYHYPVKLSEGFPQMIRDIQRGTHKLFRFDCDLDVDELWDTEQIVASHMGVEERWWRAAFVRFERQSFEVPRCEVEFLFRHYGLHPRALE